MLLFPRDSESCFHIDEVEENELFATDREMRYVIPRSLSTNSGAWGDFVKPHTWCRPGNSQGCPFRGRKPFPLQLLRALHWILSGLPPHMHRGSFTMTPCPDTPPRPGQGTASLESHRGNGSSYPPQSPTPTPIEYPEPLGTASFSSFVFNWETFLP